MSAGLIPSGPLSRGVENLVAPRPTSGTLPHGLVSAAALVYADGDAAPLSMDLAGALRSSTTVVPPAPGAVSHSQAPIEAALAGDNTLVAAPGIGLRIYVLQLIFVTSAAVNVRLRSAATNLTGLMTFTAAGGAFAVDAPVPNAVYKLGLNEALIANLSAAVGINGSLVYTVDT